MDVIVRGKIADFVAVYLGHALWRDMREKPCFIEGDQKLAQSLPGWIGLIKWLAETSRWCVQPLDIPLICQTSASAFRASARPKANHDVGHVLGLVDRSMSVSFNPGPRPMASDWSQLMLDLGPRFAERTSVHDANDSFVAENFAELKALEVLRPAYRKSSVAMRPIRTFRLACSRKRSLITALTALALSMHTHVVAAAAWRWPRHPELSEHLLRRVADENLVVVSSGGSDWLTASGAATRVEGGWSINARKIFASGIPAGDPSMTQAYLTIPNRSNRAALCNSGQGSRGSRSRTAGTRCSARHRIAGRDNKNVFVADSGISPRRPAGKLSDRFI